MATVTSAWAKPGAWALESEQHAAIENTNLSSAAADPSPDFPSLAAAAASKSSKKKKPQPQSLAEFAGGKPVSHGAASRYRPGDASSSKGFISDEFSQLPTGPRERSAEELERSSRGFGYGSVSRVSGDDSRRNRDLNRDLGPSRADEVEDWGSMKRSGGLSERRERGGGFFDSQSRADEVDSWVSKRNSAFAGNGVREKRVGFDMFNKDRSAADTWGRKREEVNGGGGGGRPRLVLQPRTLPMANGVMDGDCEGNLGEKNAPIVNSKGANPFGFARPREEVLAEKGKDWKKIDEKLEPVKMRERDELISGRKGWGLVNESLAEDRTERSWRKEVASDSLASMSGFSIPRYI